MGDAVKRDDAAGSAEENQGWLQRWDEGRIGFHLGVPNPWLCKYAASLPKKSTVFVPLCGKTLDLHWLAEQGYQVVGSELSERAVEAFHVEAGLQPEVERVGRFRVYRSSVATIWQGDFFELNAAQLGSIDALWDRAALIALPASRRPAYFRQLDRLLSVGARGLMLCLRYPEGDIEGPPYSVDEAEMLRLLPPGVRAEQLEVADVLAENPRFQERGCSRLEEVMVELLWHHD